METQPPLSFWQKNKLLIKAFFIGFLILALLIPTFSIMFLVSDREKRRDEVVQEVSSKWSGAQTLTGPFLAIPYDIEEKDAAGKIVIIKKTLNLLPDELIIDGTILPDIRKRSIFEVPVYTSHLKLSGKYDPLKVSKIDVPMEKLRFNEAVMCFGISDLKGIEEELQLKWNDSIAKFESGATDVSWLNNSISCSVGLSLDSLTQHGNNFSMDVSLKGSQRLYFTPVGNTTQVHIESSWVNPAFDGKYIPDKKEISKKGFKADWKILHFNRDFRQYFSSDRRITTGDYVYHGDMQLISSSDFGVNLLQPVDAYGQTMRSVKYAVLIIALTFFLYFFLEIFYRRSVHPLQYVLIGFAMVIFYTLLLSISEYLQFGLAYLIASVATVSLISWYTKSIFKKWSIVLLFSLILSMLYLFIYVLIQLQDDALLFGSIGLFVLLSIIMYFSRKISWSVEEKKEEAID